MTLPNLFIVGVNKSGTTSLFNYLVSHPDVCGSAIKETFYFTPLVWGEEMKPLSEYEKQFAACGGQRYVMEATPRYYFGGEKVAEAIKKTCPNSKVIILFREPIGRLFSFYRFKKRTQDLSPNLRFGDFVDQCLNATKEQKDASANKVLFGIEESQYADQLEAWINHFGAENVMILFQDALLSQPKALMNELAFWLDIDPKPFDSLYFARENTAQGFKHAGLQRIARKLFKSFERFWTANPKIKRSLASIYYALNGSKKKEELDRETKELLQRYFEPHNMQLAKQLNNLGYTDLPDWLSEH